MVAVGYGDFFSHCEDCGSPAGYVPYIFIHTISSHVCRCMYVCICIICMYVFYCVSLCNICTYDTYTYDMHMYAGTGTVCIGMYKSFLLDKRSRPEKFTLDLLWITGR